LGEPRSTSLEPSTDRLSSRFYLAWVRWNAQLAYLSARVFGRVIYRATIVVRLKPGDLKPGYRYVIAANHQSRVDPFLICGALPSSAWRRLQPLRFFAYNGLMRYWPLRWALLGLGCFPTKPLGRLPYGLAAAQGFLAAGQSIFIFPEGKRSLPGEERVHHGVEVLATDPNVRVIPVHLQWQKGWRRSYQLTVGRPLPPSPTAEEVYDAIYRLRLP
jgi:1-acyl-sn-glycerol-3-phosphate acyltransferase